MENLLLGRLPHELRTELTSYLLNLELTFIIDRAPVGYPHFRRPDHSVLILSAFLDVTTMDACSVTSGRCDVERNINLPNITHLRVGGEILLCAEDHYLSTSHPRLVRIFYYLQIITELTRRYYEFHSILPATQMRQGAPLDLYEGALARFQREIQPLLDEEQPHVWRRVALRFYVAVSTCVDPREVLLGTWRPNPVMYDGENHIDLGFLRLSYGTRHSPTALKAEEIVLCDEKI